MIIIGYPGIGKSTVAKNDYRFIDLDSSPWKDIPNWAKYYIDVAEELSSQKYYVLVSSHDVVRNRLYRSKEPVVLCYPDPKLKGPWISKLYHRFQRDHNGKNMRAYRHVEANFDEDIERMSLSPHKKLVIPTMKYNLKKLIVDYFETAR